MVGDPKINAYCMKRYGGRPYCESTDYDTQLLNRSPLHQGDILIRPPSKQTICIFSPKATLLDLTILIADVFGLWLGLSIGFLLDKIKPCTRCTSFDDFLVNLDGTT